MFLWDSDDNCNDNQDAIGHSNISTDKEDRKGQDDKLKIFGNL